MKRLVCGFLSSAPEEVNQVTPQGPPGANLTLKEVRLGGKVQSDGQRHHQDGEEQQRLEG